MAKEVDAITKLYDLLLWMIPKIEKFPRSQKFVLGDRMETLMLDILDLLIQAAYSKNKQAVLRSANLKLEQLALSLKTAFLRPMTFLSTSSMCLGLDWGTADFSSAERKKLCPFSHQANQEPRCFSHPFFLSLKEPLFLW